VSKQTVLCEGYSEQARSGSLQQHQTKVAIIGKTDKKELQTNSTMWRPRRIPGG